MPHELPFLPLGWADDPRIAALVDTRTPLPTQTDAALLGELAWLVSAPGQLALRDAADDQNAAPMLREGTPLDTAVALLQQRQQPIVAQLLARARAAGSRARPAHASYQLTLPDVVVGDVGDAALRLEAALGRASNRRGPAPAPRALVTRSGQQVLLQMEVEGQAALGVLSRGGALRLHTLARHTLPLLLDAVFAALSNAPRAPRRPMLSLAAVARRGRAGLTLPRSVSAKVSGARVIALEWDGDDDRGVLRGHDVLASAERRGMRISSGKLTELVLRVVLRGDGVVDAWLREPDELTLNHERHAPLVHTLLAAWGVMPGETAADDLWSQDPWVLPEASWRASLGSAYDRLVDDGALVSITARAQASPREPHAGRALVAIPLGNDGDWWGTSEDPSIAAVTLTDEQLRSVALEPDALGASLQSRLGLTGPRPSLDTHGVLDLGHRSLPKGALRVFLVLRAPGTRANALALADRVRRAAVPDPPVLLVPRGRTTETGLAEAELLDPGGDLRAELRGIVRAAGLGEALDLKDLAPPSARLVLCRTTSRAWWDGELITLPDSAFALLLALAERPGAVVATAELGARISRRADPNATARQTRGLLAKALTRAGIDGEWVKTVGRRGYQLTVPSFVG